MNKRKTAIVLLNLGGPNSLQEVKSFLFSLFFDKRIIALPIILRWLIARILSSLRARKAIEIYKKLGGKSPILSNTKIQAKKLEELLKNGQKEYKVFITMRHGTPSTQEAVTKIEKFSPVEIVLLPLYPHFSSTTTLSAFEEMEKEIKKSVSLRKIEVKKTCCYYDDKKFIESQVALIKEAFLDGSLKKEGNRILFSAHSLPCSIIEKGDPYQWQIERNVGLIMSDPLLRGIDYKICYQSKVGPQKWLEPTTEKEIRKAASDRVGVVIVPISFVSEHSETLVELDIDYKNLAKQMGVPSFVRVKTQGDSEIFIESLKGLCLKSLEVSIKTLKKDIRIMCPKKLCFCISGKNG